MVLRGRGEQLKTLDGLLADVRAGRSRVLVVRGEPGIGKTALLSYAADSAPDFRVIRAEGVQSEMELPFAALHQLCGRIMNRSGHLPGPQQDALDVAFGLRSGSPPDRFLVGLAVLSLLSDAATEQPVLCLIDDAQWLDRASAQALGFVARRLLAEPVALLVAARESGGEFTGLPELVVGGLREGDAWELLGLMIMGPLDERVRDRILAEAAGNPLALLELPRALTPAELAGGFGEPGAAGLSARIEDSFLRRLQALPADTRRLLLVAAAEPAGDAVLVWRAAERLGIGVDAAAAGEADPRSDPDRHAWHRAQATLGPDEQVAAELENSAGRAQAPGGLAAAAAFLERSVALTLDPSHRAERALAAAQAKYQAGAFDAALGLLAAADAGPLNEFGRARTALRAGRSRSGPGAVAKRPNCC